MMLSIRKTVFQITHNLPRFITKLTFQLHCHLMTSKLCNTRNSNNLIAFIFEKYYRWYDW